jgi:hypothetical protein
MPSRTPTDRRRPFALLAPLMLVIALLALMLTACGPAAAPPPPRLQQIVDGLTIGLEATASPKLNASEQLIVVLIDAQGRPVEGAEVYVDLTMPAMPMGTNRPIAEAQGQGRYLAQTAYTMTGDWEVTVVATVEGKEHRAMFPITAVE